MRPPPGPAPASEREDARPLCLDPRVRVPIADMGDKVLFPCTNLKRQGALARFREEVVRVEAEPDLTVEPEPVEPAGREDHGVEAALAAFAQARVDVPAQRLDRQLRLERQQLSLAPARRGAAPHPRS